MSLLSRVALAAVTAVLLLAAPGPLPANAATPSGYAVAAVRATNAQRDVHDRRTLRTDRCLTRFAVAQAMRMAAQRRMFHQPLQPPLRRCGLVRVGENVAAGYPTGRAVVRRGWMHSPPHRANILDRRYRLIAVGAVRGPDGRWYVSQLFGRR